MERTQGRGTNRPCSKRNSAFDGVFHAAVYGCDRLFVAAQGATTSIHPSRTNKESALSRKIVKITDYAVNCCEIAGLSP
ncbi:hypothetical protein AAFF_G00276590 [Aldrovandia affinis]|uniref:Uncharacterized protein n=1 Tax=Aldrovandia affinis TaxID=143900 RepID=A0AAD7RAK0_9TELE|nr:hypothetical protein AAFF_G00276590 [Aldrovandia affinis]